MPYHDELRNIENQVDFKKRICIDLKKYDVAARELAQGNPQQIQ
jgi:hypothetical protein